LFSDACGRKNRNKKNTAANIRNEPVRIFEAVYILFFSQYNDLFNDANTVIYGHHMRNGSMFQNLVKYGDEEFFNSHRLGLLYTPGKTYWLEIIAAYITPADSGFDQVIFDSEEAEKNYFRTLLERDDHEIAYSVDELGPILTLSTCTYEYNNARYIVQARIHE